MKAKIDNLVEYKTPFKKKLYGFVNRIVRVVNSDYVGEETGDLLYFVSPLGKPESMDDMVKESDMLEVYSKDVPTITRAVYDGSDLVSNVTTPYEPHEECTCEFCKEEKFL